MLFYQPWWKSVLEFLNKVRNELLFEPVISHLSIYFPNTKLLIWKDNYVQLSLYIAAPDRRASIRKQLIFPIALDKDKHTCVCVYTME